MDGMTCIHAWIIQPAHGPTSHGKCKLCPAEREFKNSVTEKAYADFKPGWPNRRQDTDAELAELEG